MGYSVNEAFPSKYLSAADLQGRPVDVVIDSATQEQMKDGEHKLCIYFRGKKKGMILNKTNARRIADMYGDHTDGWIGQPITLVVAEVEYQGDTVQALRVKGPARGASPAAVPQRPQPNTGPYIPPASNAQGYGVPLEQDLDDSIPFAPDRY